MFRCRIPPPRRLRDRGRDGGGDVHAHHDGHGHDDARDPHAHGRDDARARLHRDDDARARLHHDDARAHPLLLRFHRFFQPQSPESSLQR